LLGSVEEKPNLPGRNTGIPFGSRKNTQVLTEIEHYLLPGARTFGMMSA
jgi:hypothetical protein